MACRQQLHIGLNCDPKSQFHFFLHPQTKLGNYQNMKYLITSGPASVLQAALESRAACTTEAGPEVIKPVDKFKF